MIFLGCDPGIAGAVAIWRPADSMIDIHDMPTLTMKRGKRDRREIDAIELARILDAHCQHVTLAVIEQAQTIPGTAGIMQAFQCGQNFGIAYGALAAQSIEIERVPPNVWKLGMSCPKAKDGARALAKKRLPKYSHLFARQKDDGRAEAALMALFAELVVRKRGATP